jgi:uncharacterized protein (DUF1800 family)
VEADEAGPRRFVARGEVVRPREPNSSRIAHLLDRAAFGATPELIESIQRTGIEEWIEAQLHPELIQDTDLERRLADYPVLTMSTAELIAAYPADAEDKSERPQQIVEQLSGARITRAVHGEAQLREVLVDFWLNHFNVYALVNKGRYVSVAYERDAIRPHVLGRFEDLLVAVAQSPAMLYYLDNYLSSAEGSRPTHSGINENYARELLELHTLGIDGGYSQEDIIHVARAFTGWSITGQVNHGTVEFLYREKWHDTGAKQFLGEPVEAGQMEEGLEILRRLAAHPSTAQHIATKLAQRFVSDAPPAGLVARLRNTFLRTGGDLREVTREILLSREFWSPSRRGVKVKTPLEFYASALRATGGEVVDGEAAKRMVSYLGQPLYAAPAPTGWPEPAPALVGAGTMLRRFNVAVRIVRDTIPGVDTSAWRDLLPEEGEPDPRALVVALLSRQPSRTTARALREAQDSGATAAELVTLVLSSPDFQRQ